MQTNLSAGAIPLKLFLADVRQIFGALPHPKDGLRLRGAFHLAGEFDLDGHNSLSPIPLLNQRQTGLDGAADDLGVAEGNHRGDARDLNVVFLAEAQVVGGIGLHLCWNVGVCVHGCQSLLYHIPSISGATLARACALVLD